MLQEYLMQLLSLSGLQINFLLPIRSQTQLNNKLSSSALNGYLTSDSLNNYVQYYYANSISSSYIFVLLV